MKIIQKGLRMRWRLKKNFLFACCSGLLSLASDASQALPVTISLYAKEIFITAPSLVLQGTAVLSACPSAGASFSGVSTTFNSPSPYQQLATTNSACAAAALAALENTPGFSYTLNNFASSPPSSLAAQSSLQKIIYYVQEINGITGSTYSYKKSWSWDAPATCTGSPPEIASTCTPPAVGGIATASLICVPFGSTISWTCSPGSNCQTTCNAWKQTVDNTHPGESSATEPF